MWCLCQTPRELRFLAKSNALILSNLVINYKPKPCVFPVSLRLPFIAESKTLAKFEVSYRNIHFEVLRLILDYILNHDYLVMFCSIAVNETSELQKHRFTADTIRDITGRPNLMLNYPLFLLYFYL